MPRRSRPSCAREPVAEATVLILAVVRHARIEVTMDNGGLEQMAFIASHSLRGNSKWNDVAGYSELAETQ